MAGLISEPRTYDTGAVSSLAVLPEPPPMWSYSSLKEIETCPRRYVLSRADYPDLWDRHGYPRVPVAAAIKGDVVHGALEVIVKALVRVGCPSTRSADAVAVLRELGGYTAVATEVLAKQLSRFHDNPRVAGDRRQQLERSLTEWLPEAREQIQTYLNRMELASTAPKVASSTATKAPAGERFPAGLGDHPEQELVVESLRLHGRVDLLSVDPAGAKITDFKTGAEDVAHHDQLRMYALLWSRDSVVNPGALAVTALAAAYPNHEVEIDAPSGDELAQLGLEIAARVTAADEAVLSNPPIATPGDHCSLCAVRPLCDTYWASRAPKTAEVCDGDWYDFEGTVLSEHGVKSWVVRETRSGNEVLVRTPAPSVKLPLDKTVRIIGVRRAVDLDEADALIASMNGASETFEVTN